MTDVFTFSEFDPLARPQDDLFRHVNGTWLKTVTIPADKPMAGAFVTLRDAAEVAVRDIIVGAGDTELDERSEEPTTRARGQIADLYASFMDEATIESLGLAPLRPELDRALGIADTADLAVWLGTALRRGVGGAIALGVESDPGDPSRTVLFVGQGGIGLPDEAYYREDQHAEVRVKYVEHLGRLFTLAGVQDPHGAAQRVFALETQIAANHWDIVRCRDWQQTYNLMERDAVEALTPQFSWSAFWAGVGVSDDFGPLVVEQPSFVEGFGRLVEQVPITTWREWAASSVAMSLAPYANAPLADENFNFRGRVLQGLEEQRERWKRGVSLVEGALGEAVGQVYVERHFSPVAKRRIDELVANLVDAYRESISKLDWMTEETRSEALAKLDKFDAQIGYPKRWRDYSGLVIDRADLIGNVIRSNEFDYDYELAKLGRPIDRDEWLMTPQTVNAYYHPLRNQIVFPAAILQPPFFDAAADDAVNYGGIGSVIGHEIGHGFDDQGSQCDGDGLLRNWWTAADREAFEQRTGALIAQYDALVLDDRDEDPIEASAHDLARQGEPIEGVDEHLRGALHVNGSLTIGENIGDLGGVSIAYLAWTLACGGVVPEPIFGYTGAQRFFLSYATIWRAKIRPEAARQRIAIDPHSPNEFRCNQVIKNVTAFAEAFDVGPEDALWLDPADRVKIW